MIIYRPHRGNLSESMAEVVEIETKDDLIIILLEKYTPYITDITFDNVHVKSYGYDDRVDWNTYLVTIDGIGIVGFTNAMVD